MSIFFLLFFLAFIPAVIASSKGRSGFAWWIYGFFLFPLALVHSLVTGDPKRNRICPFCKLKIMNDATVCQHCHRDLPAPEAAPVENRFAGSMEVDPAPGSPAPSPRSHSEAYAAIAILGLTAAIVMGVHYLTGHSETTESPSSPLAAALARCEPLRGSPNFIDCRDAAFSGALRAE